MDYSKIKYLAELKRISIPELANEIGMSKKGLYLSIENKSLRVEILEKIAEVLNEPIEIFFYGPSSDSDNITNVHERRLAKLRQIELQLKTGSDEEIIQQFNLKDEEIKKLKRKLHVIESMIYQIKGFQDKLLKELDPGLSNALNRDKAYRVASEQLMKAIDAILNIDRDETKLDEYREFIYKLAIEQGIIPPVTDNMESKKED